MSLTAAVVKVADCVTALSIDLSPSYLNAKSVTISGIYLTRLLSSQTSLYEQVGSETMSTISR